VDNPFDIGLYGGTFDPVHNVHIELAYTALKFANLKKIIFVPAGIPPHKKGKVFASAEDRYNMLLLATQNEPMFSVTRFEVESKNPSFTIKTIEHFLNLYKNVNIHLITGLDTLIDIPNWYHADELIEKIHTFLVAKRPNFMEKKISPHILLKTIWLPFEPKNIASHQIRLLVMQGKDIKDLVPVSVERYIHEHRLYRTKK